MLNDAKVMRDEHVGQPTIALEILQALGLRNFNQGYASALAYLLLIVMMVIATFFFNRTRANYD